MSYMVFHKWLCVMQWNTGHIVTNRTTYSEKKHLTASPWKHKNFQFCLYIYIYIFIYLRWETVYVCVCVCVCLCCLRVFRRRVDNEMRPELTFRQIHFLILLFVNYNNVYLWNAETTSFPTHLYQLLQWKSININIWCQYIQEF